MKIKKYNILHQEWLEPKFWLCNFLLCFAILVPYHNGGFLIPMLVPILNMFGFIAIGLFVFLAFARSFCAEDYTPRFIYD